MTILGQENDSVELFLLTSIDGQDEFSAMIAESRPEDTLPTGSWDEMEDKGQGPEWFRLPAVVQYHLLTDLLEHAWL